MPPALAKGHPDFLRTPHHPSPILRVSPGCWGRGEPHPSIPRLRRPPGLRNTSPKALVYTGCLAMPFRATRDSLESWEQGDSTEIGLVPPHPPFLPSPSSVDPPPPFPEIFSPPSPTRCPFVEQYLMNSSCPCVFLSQIVSP